MRVTVKKWGNSASIRIPASVMKAASLHVDDVVEVREDRGRVIVEPAPADSADIGRLIAGITPDNLHEEEGFGTAVGKETF